MSVLDRAAERRDALRTDLYQLTMAAAYFEAGLEHESTFELFTRRLEAHRGFYIACGLELALDYLEGLRFTGAEIDYLRGLRVFSHVSPRFFERLRDLRFTGEVWAMPEGTPFFPGEPILRVTGPTLEAQLVETYLLSIINEQTLIATKAARIVRAARGKHVSDFGTRRAHGPEAGELVARASYVGGAASTSNVEAGYRMGIPVKGTFAHSWVMSFEREEDAFSAYARVFPGETTLLIDTYDTLEGARKALAIRPAAVRIDSGDLALLSKRVRRILDDGGCAATKIVASGDLNEEKIEALEAAGAPIDVYGVGTELAVSKDMPALGGVYKLVERRGPGGEAISTMKLSAEKKTWPGAKQVYRKTESGKHAGDTIGLAREAPLAGAPLLERVFADGKRLRPAPTLPALREHAAREVARLPEKVRDLHAPGSYPVTRSPALEALAESVAAKHAEVTP
ncbi:MAG TPA: nicotinate phosphoribosyltransferase [Planctomycetota bacterium]|nr:nicotinate phosphoribosyltransferase [Planctomycetota bacterium]